MLRGLLPSLACLFCATTTIAEPLSKKTDIDFFRDVPSRNLKGLATRSDGRLVAGPTLKEITAPAPADLLWCIEPTDDPARFLLGTGPDGKIVEITLAATEANYTAKDVAKLDDPQIFALKRLRDGTILAGTSPKGAIYLVRAGQPVARAMLPVDSIFDFLLLDDTTVLAATGNPGRVYKIDLTKFATVGLIADKITDTKILADRGITLFGEVRDRNIRRLAAFPDGRIIAGSAPKGNVYTFARDGGAPVLLQENRDAEVTDLLPQPNGDVYATIVFSATSGESRITPSGSRPPKADPSEPPPPAQAEKFGGRSSLIWFPAGGFPETLTSRSGVAFYRVLRFADTLLVAGGEQGEMVGYDLKSRLSLTFAGSISSQVNGMVPLPAPAGARVDSGRFLVLRNNAPGLALLDFNAPGAREAETRRIDLGTPSLVGALRFNRLRNVAERDLLVDMRVSNGSDDIEGWGPWTSLKLSDDSGWRAEGLRGRNARLRLRLLDSTAATVATPPPRPVSSSAKPAAVSGSPGASTTERQTSAPAFVGGIEIDRASLYALAQNRRPQLQDFRILTPNFGLIAAVDQPPPANVALSQIMQSSGRDDDVKRKGNFLSSQVVPSPGTQVALWTVTDPDNDNFACTFSIRRDGDSIWTDIAANSHEGYAQFDTGHLPDGTYFTRLVATETAPRPASERLSQTFETDDLVVDHTPPEIVTATARRSGETLIISVEGRDKLSLLDGIEIVFNNSIRETVEQPADGVRDGRQETFVLEMPIARVSNATSVEVTLYDAAGNDTSRRLTW